MAKGKREKEDEQVRFATFEQFCKSTTAEKQKSIAETSDEITDLKADIAKYAEEIMVATKEIAGHEATIATASDEKAKATAEREKEHADFEVELGEYTDSIDAVERALDTMKEGNKDVALVQQRAVLGRLATLEKAPERARKVLASFLQAPHDTAYKALLEAGMELDDGSGAPEAKAYEAHSGGVVEMVEGMGEKFEDKKNEIEKQEMNMKQAYNMMVQDLDSQIKSNTKSSSKKTAAKGAAGEAKAQAEGDLATAEASLADDEKYLTDLTNECTQKAMDYEKRQTVRQGEIEAIQKAIEIMSSGAVAGGSQHTYLLQEEISGFKDDLERLQGRAAIRKMNHVAASLAQLRSASSSSTQKSVADFLEQRAAETGSRVLSLMATRVSADPFKKVSKMIKDMITKLMEEANEEAEHKGFCDTEMATNKNTRDAKTEDVEQLTAEAQKLNADIAQLAEEITMIGEEITQLDAEMAKSTALREAEKEKNTATIEDAKTAQAATAQAIAVLKEFYSKAAVEGAGAAESKETPVGAINYDTRAIKILNSASLLQAGAERRRVPGGPEMEEGGYTGMGSGGIVGLLEVIESDFARLIAETEASETEAAGEYTTLSNENAEDRAVKEMDTKNKAAEKTRKESALANTKKDLASTQAELVAAMEYFDKLKPSCVEQGVSYEERVAKRKEEIESLQEAMKILSESTP